MADLSVSNTFSAGTQIVASQMNTNFTDVTGWATGSPNLSATGGTTTVEGALKVDEGVTIDGATPLVLEGSSANDFEISVAVTDPTADRTITLPDASGTVALTDIVFESQTGTTYTLVLADSGKIVEMNNASANTLTVPPNSSVAFAVGTQIVVVQQGAGQTTIAAGSGVTLRSESGNLKIGFQYSSVALVKRATDEWYVVGNLGA